MRARLVDSDSRMTPMAAVIGLRRSVIMLIIIAAASAFAADAFTANTSHQNNYDYGHSIHRSSFSLPSASTKTLLFNYQNNNNGQEEGGETTTSSIGDVVQNLHGGKYQFSETQYLAGGSLMGQQFAESLYSGAADDESCYAGEGEDENLQELPNWARRLQDSTEQFANKPILETLSFDQENNKVHHSISIKNDERSWERYYVFILHRNNCNGSAGCPFAVSPMTRSLAPRGGASNACDETKPYSDSATISIEWVGDSDSDSDGIHREAEDEWLLVAGTEAEVWRYQLKIV